MDAKREGEIALVLLKQLLKKRGFTLGNNLKRELGNVSKETGISVVELKEFGKKRAEELMKDTFGN